MNAVTDNSLVMRNTVFAWIALATCLVLLVPLVAMRFTTEVGWGIADFIVMGALLFGSGSLYVLLARRFPRRYRVAIGVILAVVLLYAWAELAVGIATSLGS